MTIKERTTHDQKKLNEVLKKKEEVRKAYAINDQKLKQVPKLMLEAKRLNNEMTKLNAKEMKYSMSLNIFKDTTEGDE